jgi:drug/metabolite transporter (DMT)-like permease
MDAKKFAALLLIVAGALALVYGGFTYTKESHKVDVGSLHVAVDEKQHVSVPVWAGIGALLVGGFLLTVSRKSS